MASTERTKTNIFLSKNEKIEDFLYQNPKVVKTSVSRKKKNKNFSVGKSSFHDQLQPFPFAPCWPGGLCDTNSKQVFCVYSCLSLVESPHHCTNTDKRRGIFSSSRGGETCSPTMPCISGADAAPWLRQSSPALHRNPFLLPLDPRQGYAMA